MTSEHLRRTPRRWYLARVQTGAVGRPVVTSPDEIESVAFALFEERGFRETTVDAIAAEVGIGRRTLFRYYDSKNDIPWGRFDESLEHFREILDASDPTLPLYDAVHRAVLAFNDFGEGQLARHRRRMNLILSTPALEAHSAIRYAQWREVIASYVARRRDLAPTDLLPISVGHVSLGLAVSAYRYWLTHPGSVLLELLDEAMSGLRAYLDLPGAGRSGRGADTG